jgi:hypothetical protein
MERLSRLGGGVETGLDVGGVSWRSPQEQEVRHGQQEEHGDGLEESGEQKAAHGSGLHG